MKFQYMLFTLTLDGLSEAYDAGPGAAATASHPVQAACAAKQLSRVAPESIEVRSGSSSRSVPLSEIQSLEVTAPVNRGERLAWATIRTRGGEEQAVAVALPTAGTLVFEGTDAEGKRDTIDALTCKRVVFKAS